MERSLETVSIKVGAVSLSKEVPVLTNIKVLKAGDELLALKMSNTQEDDAEEPPAKRARGKAAAKGDAPAGGAGKGKAKGGKANAKAKAT